jgi:8-oxo-dGTP pyrophosphatase MutT (NUDIX family)
MAVDLAASVAVLVDGKILLIQRADIAVWSLPSGGVEPGESIAEAAIRETQEETGLIVQLDRLVGLYSLPQWHSGGNHVALFAGHPVGGVLQPQAREVLKVDFFAPDALPTPLLWWHQQRIRDALQGVGGSVAWRQAVRWPFAPTTTPAELRPTMPATVAEKQALYAHYFSERTAGDEQLEVSQGLSYSAS